MSVSSEASFAFAFQGVKDWRVGFLGSLGSTLCLFR